MSPAQVVLVTGTSTEVGKTIVTAALAARATAAGQRVAIVKPAQTGLPVGVPGDARIAGMLAGVSDVHEYVRLPDPLAPRAAARLSGLHLPSLLDAAVKLKKLAAQRDLVVVEGSGGLLVQLDDEGRALTDLVPLLHEQGCAVTTVVVVDAGLGTLNHTALTVEALRHRRVPIHGLVIGRWPQQPTLVNQCNLDDLPQITGAKLLGRIPDGAGSLTSREFRFHARTWLSQLDGN
ncbi:MAG: dethiobiotin synthase [Actinomycetota bacterium]